MQPHESQQTKLSDQTGATGADLPYAAEAPPAAATAGPQLTARAVVTGALLGGLLSICNIYAGLKLGLNFGMSLTGALLGFGVWTALHALAPFRVRRWSILEGNICQTACSAGASVAAAGLIAPIPALTLLTGQTLPWPQLTLWIFSVMLLGILLAIPLRRQMILHDRLTFPEGVASAELLRELHERGGAALRNLYAFSAAVMAAAIGKLVTEIWKVRPFPLPFRIGGQPSSAYLFGLDPNPLLFGIGGLIGLRISVSLLLGALLAYALIGPALIQQDLVQPPMTVPLAVAPPESPAQVAGRLAYDPAKQALTWRGVMSETQYTALRAAGDDPAYLGALDALRERARHPVPSFGQLRDWLQWPGVTLMVIASLVSLAFSWQSIVAVFRRPWQRQRPEAPESPRLKFAWVLGAAAGAVLLTGWLQISFFGITLPLAVLSVLLSFILAMVAARISGETGLGATGPLGKVAQITFGALAPTSPVPNLMAANVTAGAASQCADLMNDLKCGHLLGASPRAQTLAQLAGAVGGAMVGCAAYLVLVPDPAAKLGTPEWPAVAVFVWKSVAEVFVEGLNVLPAGASRATLIAALAGIAFATLERISPVRVRSFLPSPLSVGLGFILPPFYVITIFVGGLTGAVLRRLLPASGRLLTVIFVALIVGESLTGLGLAFFDLFAGE